MQVLSQAKNRIISSFDHFGFHVGLSSDQFKFWSLQNLNSNQLDADHFGFISVCIRVKLDLSQLESQIEVRIIDFFLLNKLIGFGLQISRMFFLVGSAFTLVINLCRK